MVPRIAFENDNSGTRCVPMSLATWRIAQLLPTEGCERRVRESRDITGHETLFNIEILLEARRRCIAAPNDGAGDIACRPKLGRRARTHCISPDAVRSRIKA